MTETTVTIETDPDRMRQFCRSIARVTHDPSRLLTMLTAVKTFLSASAGPDAKVGAAYSKVLEILDEAIDEAQERVIQERAGALAKAIIERAPAMIARVHGALSRGGFAQAFEQVLLQLDGPSARTAAQWSEAWRTEAWRRAEAASGYPDAPDFKAAGLDHREYAAMADLAALFSRRTVR